MKPKNIILLFVFGLFILFLIPQICFAFYCCSSTVGDVIAGGDGYCCDGNDQYYCECVDGSYFGGTCNDIEETYIQDCDDYDGCSDGYDKDYECSGGSCVLDSNLCTDNCCQDYWSNPDAYCEDGLCWSLWGEESCSSACAGDGYYAGLCTTAGSCPYSGGNDCFYGCDVKTGTTCDDYSGDYICYCIELDTEKPSCDRKVSGSTCYYNGVPECTENSGWECDYNNNCYMDECCDCTTSGCDKNDDNCSTGFICDSGCDCQGPDLYIVNIENFTSDKKVYYEIGNQGDADADSSHSYLYIDNSYKEDDYVSSIPDGGYSEDENFSNWTCTAGQTYSIKVCADGDDEVDEEDEDNNCRTESKTCPSGCTGNLSVSITGSGTCDIEAKIYPSDCDSESYRIKENGIIKWSGTLSGDNTITRSGTVDVGSDYDYDLEFYIDGVWEWQNDDLNNICSETPCICGDWSNQSCGYSTCDSYYMGQTRICDPSGCDPGDGYNELRCICSESCCTDWVDQDCSLGGCAATEMYQIRDCGTCPYLTSRCVSDPTCGGVVTIDSPVVITVGSPIVSEDPSNPGKYRAILSGFLDSLGYDPGVCTNCKCIVWFKWGTSGSYGNSNTPIEITIEDDYFYYTADNLDPSTTYYFEAFAKNGGSL